MLHSGGTYPFYTNYSPTNVYCTLKIQEILNLTNFARFSFFVIT